MNNDAAQASSTDLISKWRHIKANMDKIGMGVMLFGANFLAYADRTNISVCILMMQQEYKWSNSTKGFILSSFFIGYLLTQILGTFFLIILQFLGGYLSSKFGGKVILFSGVALWSAFTIATPIAAHFLILVRILIGISEGVNMPAIHHLVSRWVPAGEKSRYMSFVATGMDSGTLLTTFVAPIISLYFGWEWVFYICGVLGLVWAVVFFFCKDEPKLHEEPATEQQHVASELLFYGKVCITPAFLAIVIAHTCYNFGWYVLISWLPGYFKSVGVPFHLLGVYTNIPYITALVVCNVAGVVADLLIPRIGVTLTRKIMQSISFFGAALFFALLRYCVGSLLWTTVCICMAVGLGTCCRVGFFVNRKPFVFCNFVLDLDIAPKYAGTLMGLTNTVATIPGVLGNIITGFLLEQFHGDWMMVFNVIIIIFLFGGIFFFIFAKGEVLFK